MYESLEKINRRPKPFEFYTAADLWTDEHTAKQMLSYHLNDDVDLSSRNSRFIDRSTGSAPGSASGKERELPTLVADQVSTQTGWHAGARE